MTVAAAHSFEPHTADVRLHLAAPELASLLAEAGRALGELLVEELPPEDPDREPLRLEVSAPDREALLVAWIDELIGRSELERVVFTRLEVTCPSPTRAVARVWTAPLTDVKTAPKAATWHGLSIRDVPGGLEGTVVLDV